MRKLPQQKSNRSSSDLMRYVGWGTQMFLMLALAVWGGSKLDAALKFKTPIFIWVLPLLVLVVMIYQLVKDTSKQNTNEK